MNAHPFPFLKQSAKQRRGCFICQVVAGILCIILQLVDVINFHVYDSTATTLTRQAAPGLWTGAVFVFVGALHLRWKPQATLALTVSILLQCEST